MKNVFKTILDNGIIISLSLGMAYFFAYCYQKGKLSYYDIPMIYADLSIASIIQIFSLILGALLLIFVFVNAILDSFLAVKDYRVCNIISRTIYLVIIISISIAFTKGITNSAWLLIGLYIFTVVIDVIMPLIRVKGKDTYANKWRKYSEIVKENNAKEKEQKKTGPFAKFKSNLVEFAAYVCAFIMVGSWFNTAGIESAMNEQNYYVANDYSNRIVVHYTVDYYILMQEKDGVLDKNFLIVPTSEIGQITYSNIGKVTINEDEN